MRRAEKADEPNEEMKRMSKFSKVIAVDFDGTLCENRWPEIGSMNVELIDYLRRCRATGDKLILWTNREGEELYEALVWCRERGLEFDAVNDNLPENIRHFGNNSRKVYADVYIDDKAAAGFDLPYRRD